VVLRAIGGEQIRPLLYGAILIAAILFLPKGLESLVMKFADWLSTFRQARALSP
jgi:branched-chain amino acid transport system permease protein